jgi:hypothetical protein
VKSKRLLSVATLVLAAGLCTASSASYAASGGAALDPGVGSVPQGTQSDKAYAQSVPRNGVTNVFATTQRVSCFRPEVSATAFNLGPNDGYSGVSACPGATTGENTGASGPYPTQVGSNPGYPASGPQLVKDHSESDIRVDPTNPLHLIASSKWFVSAEGYNHQLGFFESFDGGKTWPTQGHIPGYEGWTDNTDPVGAFDGYGNYYALNLAYQFFYKKDGSHNFTVGGSLEPNPVQPAEVISVSVRPHGSTTASQWITTRGGQPDFVATYDSVGDEPDKQWLTIDNNPLSPHYNRIYAMWVDFHFVTPVPYVSYADANPDGTHTAWSTPQALPGPNPSPTGVTYLLPHVDPNGNVYTTLTNFNPAHSYCCASIFVDKSTDGGKSWSVAGTAVSGISPPPLLYANTTFRDGIENTFAVGNHLDAQKAYPLYVSYEDYSAGVGNVLLTASYDGGATWSSPNQVNDNASAVDEFQPNLAVAADGTVSNAFYDRRLACPTAGTAEAAGAGIALDQAGQNSGYTGPVPPYGASNYCVNSSVQFYDANLNPIGHNIRLTQHTWDPQLNSPKASRPGSAEGFIGDYFGNTTSGSTDFSTFVSTYNDGTNPDNQQQQVVSTVALP